MLEVVDALLKVTQLIAIPVAICLYFMNHRKERLDREYGTYHALDDKYIDYLKLCLDNPDLDVTDTPRKDVKDFTEEQRHRELVVFTILISIMERAYLMYRDKSAAVRRTQWAGWEAYIGDWCRRANFGSVVLSLTQEFDAGFLKYLKSRVPRGANMAVGAP
jgi:hypothetical protein